MRVTRDMVHEDLQPYYNRLRGFEAVIKYRWLSKLANGLLKRAVAGKNRGTLNCNEVYPQQRWALANWCRVYKPLQQDRPLPLLIYFHGGGYVLGAPEMSADVLERFNNTRPCVVEVAPDYRKAYTEPFPAGFNDCYETLLWATNNAEQLGAL